MFLLLLGFLSAAAASGSIPDDWQQAVSRTEAILQRECGRPCVEVLHSLASAQELTNSSHDVRGKALNVFADRVLAQARHVQGWAEGASFASRVSSAAKQKKVDLKSRTQSTSLSMKMVMADTPCSSKTMCTAIGLKANKCSYQRMGMQL